MNIGLINSEKISVLCQYSKNKDYYKLKYYQDTNLTMVSSETFGSYTWRQFNQGEIKIFN